MMEYIPEHFRTAIDSGCIEMSAIIILVLKINQGKHTLVIDNVTGSIQAQSYDHVGQPGSPSRHGTPCLQDQIAMIEDKRLKRE